MNDEYKEVYKEKTERLNIFFVSIVVRKSNSDSYFKLVATFVLPL